MPIKDFNGEVMGVAQVSFCRSPCPLPGCGSPDAFLFSNVFQVINKKNAPCFTQNDEKVFSDYLQFCGIGLRNAQLYEKSQLEVKRNQVRGRGPVGSAWRRVLLLPFVFFASAGTVGSRPYDFRRTEHHRAHGLPDSHPHAIADTVPAGPGNNNCVRSHSRPNRPPTGRARSNCLDPCPQVLLLHEASKASFSRVFDLEANDLQGKDDERTR